MDLVGLVAWVIAKLPKRKEEKNMERKGFKEGEFLMTSDNYRACTEYTDFIQQNVP